MKHKNNTTKKLTPRNYHKKTLSNFKNKYKTSNIFLIKAPAGSGKTFQFKMITEEFSDKKIIMTTPRINLTHQTKKYDESWGIVQGNYVKKPFARVKIYTLQTLLNHFSKSWDKLNAVDMIFIDEAHLFAGSTHDSKSIKKLIEEAIKRDTKIIAMSATLYNAQGHPFEIFKEGIDIVPKEYQNPLKLIEDGYLCPVIIKKAGEIKEELLQMGKNDFTEKSKKIAIAQSGVDVAQVAIDYGVGQTMIFCSDTEHAKGVYEDIKSRGYTVELLTSKYKTPKALEKFANCESKFICSVDMIHTGTDIPIAQTCVLGCPIGSHSKLRQVVPRVMRTHPDKDIAYIIDCFNNVERLGYPLVAPIPKEKKTKNKGVMCQKCKSTTPLKITDIDIDLLAGVQTKYRICPKCGDTSETQKEIDIYNCSNCNTLSPLKDIYSKEGFAMFKCPNCSKEHKIAELTYPELVVTYYNREDIVRNIKILMRKKKVSLTPQQNRDIDLFLEVADNEHLSFLLDVLADIKGKYSQGAVDKVISRALQRVKDKRRLPFIERRMLELTGIVNKELSEFIKQFPDLIQHRITYRFGSWIKQDSIKDTKKYISKIKRYLTYLKKNEPLLCEKVGLK